MLTKKQIDTLIRARRRCNGIITSENRAFAKLAKKAGIGEAFDKHLRARQTALDNQGKLVDRVMSKAFPAKEG